MNELALALEVEKGTKEVRFGYDSGVSVSEVLEVWFEMGSMLKIKSQDGALFWMSMSGIEISSRHCHIQRRRVVSRNDKLIGQITQSMFFVRLMEKVTYGLRFTLLATNGSRC